MKPTLLLTIAVLALASVPAFARDSVHLVCTGFMSAAPSSDNYGMAILLDESRAADGENRLEVLSAVWQGELYQGSRLNTRGDFAKNGSVSMALKTGEKSAAKKVFFKGQYDIQETKSGDQLVLRGRLNLTPNSKTPVVETISTTLNCVDISN